jgi:hypothetical protein
MGVMATDSYLLLSKVKYKTPLCLFLVYRDGEERIVVLVMDVDSPGSIGRWCGQICWSWHISVTRHVDRLDIFKIGETGSLTPVQELAS